MTAATQHTPAAPAPEAAPAAAPSAVPEQLAATPTATAQPSTRRWVAGQQDEAWQERARELAAKRGLTYAARWRHIASEENGDQEHELLVPSATSVDLFYVVRVQGKLCVCECLAGLYQAPCAHSGAALTALEARGKAVAEGERDTQVFGSWLNGGSW